MKKVRITIFGIFIIIAIVIYFSALFFMMSYWIGKENIYDPETDVCLEWEFPNCPPGGIQIVSPFLPNCPYSSYLNKTENVFITYSDNPCKNWRDK